MKNKYAALLNQLRLREEEEPTSRDDRVLLIDGLNTFIRSYSATPTLNANGEPVWAQQLKQSTQLEWL